MNLTRRYFLKTSGALAVYCGLTPFDLLANPDGTGGNPTDNPVVKSGKTLVVIFLRGGTDGLNLVVPHAEDTYYELRRSLAIPRPGQKNGALDLDGFFGLHPSAKSLHPLFMNGQACALHAVGYDHNTRSHFEEQDVWETGVIGNTVNSDGWLNRHLLTSNGFGKIRAISIGDSLPRILRGDAPAYAVRGLSELAMPKSNFNPDLVRSALEHAYQCEPKGGEADAQDLLAQTGASTLEGIKELQQLTAKDYKPEANYPKTGLAGKLKQVARLIKGNIGLEVVEVDFGGWDTHQNQGGVRGHFANRLKELSDALAAFNQDMGSRMEDVMVLTLSDFGRTAKQNGTNGTDHGWGNCMLAMGGPVLVKSNGKARKVLGGWPGLATEQLNQKRDLKHTTDFRDVICESVKNHLGNNKLEKIIPGYKAKEVGLV